MEVSSYSINWDSEYSLHNWMTDLDLICAEPYLIGMLGAVSFMAFSIGSILITKVIDIHGRRLTLIYASSVTPIGILLMLTIGKNLAIVYAIIFFMGMTYNTRGSTAYLYGTEFLCKQSHLTFGQTLFMMVGVF